MDPLISAFWTGKAGGGADEYEDAFAWSANRRHFAIADGATESSFADRWAKSLVKKFTRERPSAAGGSVSFPEWLQPLQDEWVSGINWNALQWFAEEKARAGAFATFLGVSFLAQGSRPAPGRVMRWLGKRERARLLWRACAVGDSCLFQVRHGALLKSFPLTRSDQFNCRPLLLSSNPENNAPVWKAVELAEGECRQGDIFFALTDALAKWFLAEAEGGRHPWEPLLEIRTSSNFESFVEELRASKALRNDDTTMLAMQWSERAGREERAALVEERAAGGRSA